MNSRATYLGLVVGMTLGSGCGDSGGDSGTETTAATGTTEPGTTGGTTTGPETTGEPTTTGTTGTAGTTGEPATGTGTTGGAQEYCNGFSAALPEPQLSFRTAASQPVADGVTWPLECGGQGLWMFGLYPSLGGWDPGAEHVSFDLVVDVAGYNDNPDGHFYSATMMSYYIGCELLDGGVTGVLPVFPPDTLPDLSVLDGLPATLHVEIDAGGQTLTVDAETVLSAPKELVEGGCMFL
jgi:hypothetical protein